MCCRSSASDRRIASKIWGKEEAKKFKTARKLRYTRNSRRAPAGDKGKDISFQFTW